MTLKYITSGFRPIVAAIVVAALSLQLRATAQEINFHNEESDTVRITELLNIANNIDDPNARVAAIAREFVGTPYVGGTLDGDAEKEVLVVNLDELDCATLIDNVMAICITAGEGRRSWRDFVYNLQSLRYREGEINGYASRLHYISDWVVDNVHRGNFEEVTNRYVDARSDVKTLDFMTQNRDLYPALSNDSIYNKLKEYEFGYRRHSFPIIRSKSLSKASKGFLKDGDIIALTTSKKNLDVSHMAILVFDKGECRLLHASSKEGKVVISTETLAEYFRRNHSLTGIRVFRLKD